MLGIINDILDFSKMEAGKLAIESLPFDLNSVVHDVADILKPKAAEHGGSAVPETAQFMVAFLRTADISGPRHGPEFAAYDPLLT